MGKLSRLAAAAALLALALGGCAGSVAVAGRTTCRRPEWGPGQPASARDAVMWSAAAWGFSREVETALAPCGGGLSCDEVAAYAQELGGRVLGREACGVRWDPAGLGRSR